MMNNVKIYGAGSIGNHLAHAARTLGWRVTGCDKDDAALERMKHEIYPSRYGQWDDSIQLCNIKKVPRKGFDMIFIGTPPDSHLKLALDALREEPDALLIEKPLCGPELELAQEVYDRAKGAKTRVFAGYDHVVGKPSMAIKEVLSSGIIGEALTLDVEFREHWSGIFKAHPWLNGPQDSYLGYWKRGGGAGGEHSHALNLWQHFAHFLGKGRISEAIGMINYVKNGPVEYDNMCIASLRTEEGFIGRVVQDVITLPPRKRLQIQGTKGSVQWVSDYSPEGDAVITTLQDKTETVLMVRKKRPDDFICELEHIESSLESHSPSDIRFERGLETMLVIAALHKSERAKKAVRIDYGKGFSLSALQLLGE